MLDIFVCKLIFSRYCSFVGIKYNFKMYLYTKDTDIKKRYMEYLNTYYTVCSKSLKTHKLSFAYFNTYIHLELRHYQISLPRIY